MVLFVGIEKLLCLVMYLPICGWSEELTKSPTLVTLKMEAVYYPKYRQLHGYTTQN